jgi:hypothetical protein
MQAIGTIEYIVVIDAACLVTRRVSCSQADGFCSVDEFSSHSCEVPR